MMQVIFYIFLFFYSNLTASDFGITGVIDTPSARMKNDGALRINFNSQDISNTTNITFQATPWLETTFRYTYGDLYKDRSYAAKVLLLNESRFKPSIAIGIQDILGTGIFGSEYIVASKKINNFDVSLGMGWGRLAENNAIKNPLINLSKSFLDRSNKVNEGGKFGGKLRNSTFFKGPKVGIFGGIKYSVPNSNINFLVEYNTDSHDLAIRRKIIPKSSPLSFGIEWDGPSGFNLSLTRQQGNQIGFSFSTLLDTKKILAAQKIDPFYSSSDEINNLVEPETLNFDIWYDRLLYDMEQSGLYLRNAQIYPNNRVSIEFSNLRYNLAADAINRVITLSQIHVPSNVRNIDLILNESGHKAITINYKRRNSSYNFVISDEGNQLKILPSYNIKNPQYITKRVAPYFNINANLASRFQFFDPDEPLKYQVYLKILTIANITQKWNLISSLAIDIDNNFDLNRPPNSRLEHVRTDINKYLVKGASGIESLYFEKRSTFNEEIHYRAYIGVLEDMYSGIGFELLYQPFMSRLAVGGSFNRVKKRAYKRNFDLLDYETSTGFLSLYYASPFYNYDLAFHLGRYLAKDNGVTIEARRTFDNGFSVGAFATFTDVSSEDFGEGSFDKGLYFRLPFDSFFQTNSRNAISTIVRSLQRDGGQRLEDFSGRLWFDLRSARYDSLKRNKKRMIPK